MNVLVERYQRRKYVNQPDSQMLYYVRQKSGTVRVMDINKLADAIEANSSLTAGDVKHAIEAPCPPRNGHLLCGCCAPCNLSLFLPPRCSM